MAYYRSIVWQLLLHVGFYIAIYLAIHRASHEGQIKDLDQIEEKIVMKDAAIGDTEDHYEVFSVGSKEAFFFVLVHLFFIVKSSQGETNQAEISRDETDGFVNMMKWTIRRKILKRAVKNPFKFYRQLMTLQALVRYVTYGIPLIGKMKEATSTY